MNRVFLLLGYLMAALPVAVVDAQQNPDGQLPIGTTNQPFLFLVRDPVVHRDLNLEEGQRRALQELNDQTDAAMWSMRNKPKRLAEIMRTTTETTQRRLSEILTPTQVQRISQIELWVLGVKSLLREDVAKALDLSADARGRIQEIIGSTAQQVAALQQQMQEGGQAAQLNERHRELKTNEQTQIFALLNEDQKAKLFKLLGRRIDLSKLGRIKFKAPDFQQGDWINSHPLTMEQLKGKVVALHFYAFA